MSKPWRMTRQAERSLVEIARWTFQTFGPRQAEAYEADLIARCVAIAAGEAPSQDCRRLIDPDLVDDLRFTRVGQHFIVFVDMPDQLIIVDVLHSRSDLPRRLAALGDPKDTAKG
jgi:toxin ParE1/3/4